jgi:hypothetical protein
VGDGLATQRFHSYTCSFQFASLRYECLYVSVLLSRFSITPKDQQHLYPKGCAYQPVQYSYHLAHFVPRILRFVFGSRYVLLAAFGWVDNFAHTFLLGNPGLSRIKDAAQHYHLPRILHGCGLLLSEFPYHNLLHVFPPASLLLVDEQPPGGRLSSAFIDGADHRNSANSPSASIRLTPFRTSNKQ